MKLIIFSLAFLSLFGCSTSPIITDTTNVDHEKATLVEDKKLNLLQPLGDIEISVIQTLDSPVSGVFLLNSSNQRISFIKNSTPVVVYPQSREIMNRSTGITEGYYKVNIPNGLKGFLPIKNVKNIKVESFDNLEFLTLKNPFYASRFGGFSLSRSDDYLIYGNHENGFTAYFAGSKRKLPDSHFRIDKYEHIKYKLFSNVSISEPISIISKSSAEIKLADLQKCSVEILNESGSETQLVFNTGLEGKVTTETSINLLFMKSKAEVSATVGVEMSASKSSHQKTLSIKKEKNVIYKFKQFSFYGKHLIIVSKYSCDPAVKIRRKLENIYVFDPIHMKDGISFSYDNYAQNFFKRGEQFLFRVNEDTEFSEMDFFTLDYKIETMIWNKIKHASFTSNIGNEKFASFNYSLVSYLKTILFDFSSTKLVHFRNSGSDE